MNLNQRNRLWFKSDAAKHAKVGDGKRTVWDEAYAAGHEEGAAMAHRDAEKVGLPATPFFYTIEQVATMLQVQERTVERLTFYMGRSTGAPPKGKIIATNLSPEGETPVWRVLDRHFIQYLRFKGIRFQTQGYR